MIKRALILAPILAAAPLFAVESTDAPGLSIGDPAPPLTVIEWVRGKPFPRFEPGHTYVVEFWATWCGPCIKAMPHLTELAKKYDGKVTVVSVHAESNKAMRVEVAKQPRAGYLENIRTFVRENADKMAYTVVIDDPVKSPMSEAWLEAAGQDGIPAAFIVDRAGKIAWIGNPLVPHGELDESIARTLDGSIDVAANKARHLMDYRLQKTSASFYEAFQRKEYKSALAVVDKAIATTPQDYRLAIMKLRALLPSDRSAALDHARALSADEQFLSAVDKSRHQYQPEEADSQGWGWLEIGATMANHAGLSQDAYRLALECLQKFAGRNSDADAPWASLAQAHARLGAFDLAVKEQEKAIELLKKEAPDSPLIRSWEETLQAYKAGAGL